MISVFKVIYSVYDELGEVILTDSFYTKSAEQTNESIIKLFDDYSININDTFIEDCSIYGIGDTQDIMITIEQPNVMDDEALEFVLMFNPKT